MTVIDDLCELPPGVALTIGNFDGLHVGHRAIFSELCRRVPGKVAVATFEPHPLTVLRPEATPPRLTTWEQKRQELKRLGIDYVVRLAPAPAVLGLTAEQFWTLLRDDVRPACLVEGEQFNFGKDRGGSIAKLIEWSRDTNVHVVTMPAVKIPLGDRTVVTASSSIVRWLIRNGRVRDAARLLGRPYRLGGTVVKGYQRGRTIGVPTANLDCGEQLIPADGVYAARTVIDAKEFRVALSIGPAPTFGPSRRQVEAHVVDFDGDLYDQSIELDVIDWRRDQMRFPNVDALKARLARDIASV